MKNVKRIIAVIVLAAVMVCMLSACSPLKEGYEQPKELKSEAVDLTGAASMDFSAVEESQTEPETETVPEEPSTTEAPQTTTAAPTQAAPAQTVPANNGNAQQQNVYINETNFAPTVNALTINPAYLYWEDGKFYAYCYIVNGYYHTIYNIVVNELTFANEDGIFASAEFGLVGNGGSIGPNAYVLYKFTFDSNVISNYNADLSNIKWYSRVANSY